MSTSKRCSLSGKESEYGQKMPPSQITDQKDMTLLRLFQDLNSCRYAVLFSPYTGKDNNNLVLFLQSESRSSS